MSDVPTKTDWSTLTEGLGYVLDNPDRNHLVACRLNVQYYLWQGALKFHLHPSIPVATDSCIADVAAGTGAWLIDVARQFPSASLEGFDKDLNQAPHAKWLPSNIKMTHWDVLEDVPTDCIEKYDVIHVRLVVLVLKDPRDFLGKVFRMLKPGGYLQWDELDCVNMCVKKVDPIVKAPALEQLREMSYANGRYNWVLTIPDMMAEAGYKGASIDFVGDPDELIRAFNEQHLLTMEFLAWSLARSGEKEAASKFFQLVNDGYQESVAGAALCIPRVVCCAHKPALSVQPATVV